MKLEWTLALVALSLASSPAARAGTGEPPPDPRRLLERAHAAAGQVAFSGRQVTVMWSRRETAVTETEEYHGAGGRVRIETRRPSVSRGRVVVDDGRNRWQYEPGRRVVDRQPSAATDLGPTVALLLGQYSPSVCPTVEDVAGRPAWRVTLLPHHAGKPIRRMWIDAGTGLVLRYERSREDGRLLSASRFTSIRFGEPPASLFTRPGPPGTRIAAAHPAPRPLSLAAASARFGVTLPAALPAGYTFADANLLAGNGHPVAHLRYRDGLSAVSLYVGRRGSLPYDSSRGRPLRLRRGMGRLDSRRHIYVLSWRSPRADFALVGDATPSLLAQLANGTAPAAPAPSAALPLRMGASRWLLGLALALLALAGLSLLLHRRRHYRDTEAQRPGKFPQGRPA